MNKGDKNKGLEDLKFAFKWYAFLSWEFKLKVKSIREVLKMKMWIFFKLERKTIYINKGAEKIDYFWVFILLTKRHTSDACKKGVL